MNSKFKTPHDFRKSLEMRLQKESRERMVDLQRIRRSVAFDRLLARLFLHSEAPFLLKGGYAMELRLSSARTTKDIDLTYSKRATNQDNTLSDLILNDLQRLASEDLGDFFSYTLGTATIDLDNAPYGGARYPVSSYIAGTLFVKFHLDVGGDVVVSNSETFVTPNWLHFYGIQAPKVKMISAEQQFAEKIHAYTLPRGEKMNSRVKDLIDLLLLMRMKTFDKEKLGINLHKIFKTRDTHSMPSQLPSPPIEWSEPYSIMAKECGLNEDITSAYQEILSVYQTLST